MGADIALAPTNGVIVASLDTRLALLRFAHACNDARVQLRNAVPDDDA